MTPQEFSALVAETQAAGDASLEIVADDEVDAVAGAVAAAAEVRREEKSRIFVCFLFPPRPKNHKLSPLSFLLSLFLYRQNENEKQNRPRSRRQRSRPRPRPRPRR